MNNQDHYRIHTIELSVSVMAYIIGVGVLTIPRVLAQELGTTDGWISIAISGTLVMILITLYTRLQRNFPGKNLIQYLGDGPIGKWWAKSLSILFVIYFISLATWEVRILTVVVKLYLLDQTPSEVIAASILLLSTYAVHKGWQGVIHLNLVFMPIILFVILGVIALNISAFRLEALRPVLAEGISPVLISLKDTLLSYVGFEIIFFFMAYMKKSNLRARPLNMTIGMIMLVYILVTIMAYSVFSLDATKFITFPTFELAKEIEVPGAFFERLESLMMTVWIMTIFNTMTMCHFLAYFILKDEILKNKNHSIKKRGLLLPSVLQIVIFIGAFIPNSFTEASALSDWIARLGTALFLISLSSGYLTLWIRRQRKKTEAT